MVDIYKKTAGYKAVNAFPAIAFVIVVALVAVVLLWN
jgi:hypothetical protein